MRRGNEPSFIFHNDNLIGVNLSADYCAEHEWGIKRLREMLRTDPNARGLDKGIIRDSKAFFQKSYTMMVHGRKKSKKETFSGFLVMPEYQREQMKEEGTKIPSELQPFGDVDLCSAWSESDLGVLAKKGSSGEKHLQTIYEACKSGDGMICFSSSMKGNPFERSGLCIMIRSRIPEEWQQAAIEEEEEKARLKQGWEYAGGPEVMEKLKKAGKNWFALGTRIAELDRGDGTKALCSWLNPMEQQMYNSCWVTVDDLKDWLDNKGRIVKNRKEK